ncbi:MAG: hypothetical protein WC290_02435 [archaeon]|jgi:hypothetical protein
MKASFLSKIIKGPSRKRKKAELTLLRKKINAQRALNRKRAQLKPYVENGKKVIRFVKTRGVNKLSLSKLRILEETLQLNLIKYDKEVSLGLGFNWSEVNDTLAFIRRRIQELKKESLRNH